MPLQMRTAQLPDVDAVAGVFFSAFAKDYVMSRCFPDNPSSRQFWISGLRESIQDPDQHVMVIVDTDLPGSPIIAYAKWDAPTDKNLNRDPGPICPEGGDEVLAQEFFPVLCDRKPINMGNDPCWYIALMACHADHQGRGAGGMLMRYGIEKADAEGGRIYVEAAPPGVPVYSRFGFKEVDRVDLRGGLFTEILMRREPKNVS